MCLNLTESLFYRLVICIQCVHARICFQTNLPEMFTMYEKMKCVLLLKVKSVVSKITCGVKELKQDRGSPEQKSKL